MKQATCDIRNFDHIVSVNTWRKESVACRQIKPLAGSLLSKTTALIEEITTAVLHLLKAASQHEKNVVLLCMDEGKWILSCSVKYNFIMCPWKTLLQHPVFTRFDKVYSIFGDTLMQHLYCSPPKLLIASQPKDWKRLIPTVCIFCSFHGLDEYSILIGCMGSMNSWHLPMKLSLHHFK